LRASKVSKAVRATLTNRHCIAACQSRTRREAGCVRNWNRLDVSGLQRMVTTRELGCSWSRDASTREMMACVRWPKAGWVMNKLPISRHSLPQFDKQLCANAQSRSCIRIDSSPSPDI
jgi:hypothetical protein